MKKTMFLSLVLAIATGVSCSKVMVETSSVEQPQGDRVLMEFTATSDPLTKATLDGLNFKWEIGDEMAVWDGTSNNNFRCTEVSGNTATFRGEALAVSEYKAVYPYRSELVFKANGDIGQMNIPAKQQLVDDKPIDYRGLCATAISTDGNFHFRNVGGLIKITIPDDGIKTISIRTAEKIAGNFTATFPEGDTPAVQTKVNGVANVTLLPSGETFVKDQSVYIAVLPDTYSAGMVVSMSKESAQAFRETNTAVTIRRSSGADFGTVVPAGATWLSDEIHNKAELKAFAENAVSYPADKTIKLAADIDLGEGEAAGLAVWNPISGMKCAFDGQGHKVYNFVVAGSTDANVGFFGNVSGNISNLILGSSDGTSYDGKSAISFSSMDADAGWYNVAAIAQTSASIENVTSFVPVRIEDGNLGQVRVAGICGLASGNNVTLAHLYNYGDVLDAGSAQKEQQMGGVLCAFNNNVVSISDCINRGNVLFGTDTGSGRKMVSIIGGVIGILSGSTRNSTVEDCANYGRVANLSTQGPGIFTGDHLETFLGGVIGRANGTTTGNNAYNSLANHGDVFSSSNTVTFMGGVIGRCDAGNTLTDCVNDNPVTFDASTAAAKPINIGGIIGKSWGSTLTGCINNGAVYTNKNFANYVGGIAGTMDYSVVTGCENKAAVTDESNNTGSAAAANEQFVGGIVGLAENNETAITISGCTNSGAVTAAVFCNQGDTRHIAAGIVGGVKAAAIDGGAGDGVITISGNTNTAAVSISNKAPKGMVVAGILGTDVFGVGIANRNAVNMSGNVNKGNLSLTPLHAKGSASNEMGGVAGRTDFVVSVGDKSVCSILPFTNANTAPTVNNIGALFGTNKKGSFTDCFVGGSVLGVTLDASNFEANLGVITGDGTATGTTLVTD